MKWDAYLVRPNLLFPKTLRLIFSTNPTHWSKQGGVNQWTSSWEHAIHKSSSSRSLVLSLYKTDPLQLSKQPSLQLLLKFH